MERREFIKQMGLLGLAPHFLKMGDAWLPSAMAAGKKTGELSKKSLIVIFQRGAVDGLSMLSPLGDSHYNQEIRPNLFIKPSEMLKLDSFFSLHPALSGLKILWDHEMLLPIHQVGSPSNSRSHFDSQDFFETGTPDVKNTDTGFLARAARELNGESQFKLTSLSVQANLARSIAGDPKSLAFNDLNRFSIKGFGNLPANHTGTSPGNGFEEFFETALDEVLKGRNKNSIGLLQEFAEAQKQKIETEFPKGPLSGHLKDIARVIKSGLNIPFYVTEMGGWDSHRDQGSEKGQLAGKLKEFGDSIAAFVQELGPRMKDVTLITVTEFGRTVKENGSKGTDHGHGSCFFVVSPQVKRKAIFADWKDLKPENLYEGRDLPVTTDFRNIFSTLLKHEFGIEKNSAVFPAFLSQNNVKLFS